jgi:hypothetical protein
MRRQPARYLFAALVAIAVNAPRARAQDLEPVGSTATRGVAIDAVSPSTTAPDIRTPAPAARTTKVDISRPMIVFSAAATADWASTAWSLSHPTSREDNPLIAWANSPAAIITAGAAIDAIGAYAWMKSTTNHRKLQSVGFLVAAAFRGYLVVHNLRINRQDGARPR